MKTLNLLEFFDEIKKRENIDYPVLIKILEEVLLNAIKDEYGDNKNFNIILNPNKNDFEILHNRIIVKDEEFKDPISQIKFSEAYEINKEYNIGDKISEHINILNFNRNTILNIRKNLQLKILEYKRNNIFNEYKEKIGKIVIGKVYKIWKNEILLLDEENNEVILPKSEQIPSDSFKEEDIIKGVIIKVEIQNDNLNIIISRTSPMFLERLLEQEIKEIYNGLIVIKKIVRIPGERAKVAITSYDDKIDPVAVCVGKKGSKIHNIVRELRNENIDIINYTNNTRLYIQRALNPAKISDIKIIENEKKAKVYLNPDQISLAIGKKRVNIKLASQLTGYDINICATK